MENNNYLTISAINKYIKSKFDMDKYLGDVYLKGEISNFKAHTTGHFYFTLKDEGSRLNAVMFNRSAGSIKFTPKDGMNVLVRGKISVYDATGSYQIYVSEMSEDGIGNLYIAFEELKKKLEVEGLFDSKYKKPIPRIPRRVGVITASTGAAIKDILSTLKRRFPLTETVLLPCLVQGENAKEDIVRQIKKANEMDIDVIILGRGGGSIEDLWPFNEEIVAREIFKSNIPIISAVGHEVDYTISDFVADKRAPTPTGAAEMCVPNMLDILDYLENRKILLNNLIRNKINTNKKALLAITSNPYLKNPMMLYEMKAQKLDMLIEKLGVNLKNKILVLKTKFTNIISNSIMRDSAVILRDKNQRLELLINKCEVLNPINSLKRGYAIVKKDDKAVSLFKDFKVNDIIEVNLEDGLLSASILEIKEND